MICIYQNEERKSTAAAFSDDPGLSPVQGVSTERDFGFRVKTG
jgi:hypothetical protein